MGFLISPLSPLSQKIRNDLALVFPPAIFIWTFLFQIELMSLNPHIHYYLSPNHLYSWEMNTGICWAFGFAFSVSIMRKQTGGRKIYGRSCVTAYIILLLAIPVFSPAVMTT